ncbi:hypothetical protein LguiB_023171 [Lonicera macranthoides]
MDQTVHSSHKKQSMGNNLNILGQELAPHSSKTLILLPFVAWMVGSLKINGDRAKEGETNHGRWKVEEGPMCECVDGFRAMVERYLEVEVAGLDRDGQPIKVDASGWQARILQHECDHLDGTLYVDKMTSRTFRTVENLDLPLAAGCPKLGVS